MKFTALALLVAVALQAQFPQPPSLSASDQQEFHAEIHRLEALRNTANDTGTVDFQLAKTYAAGGEYAAALALLRKLNDAGLGFDPSRDEDFQPIRNTAEFQKLMREVDRSTPPVNHSRVIATMPQLDLSPENIAFDPATKSFLLGSTESGHLASCRDHMASCSDIGGLDLVAGAYTLGMKFDARGHRLWVTRNDGNGAALRQIDTATREVLRTVTIAGKHVFNDLVVARSGDVYVTDTAADAVYKLGPDKQKFELMAEPYKFVAANGIALSQDEATLYVSAWGDGLDAIDLRTNAVRPVRHPLSLTLAYIDGLYVYRDRLIAIQNGPVCPRIASFKLSDDGHEIVATKILERRNPAFDGITTGVLFDTELYYLPNPQTDNKGRKLAGSLRVFAVRVDGK